MRKIIQLLITLILIVSCQSTKEGSNEDSSKPPISEYLEKIQVSQADRRFFGIKVAAFGKNVAIGGYVHGTSRISILLFQKDEQFWYETANILAPEANEHLGLNGLSISDKYLAFSDVHAPIEGWHQGQVYVFENDGQGYWSKKATLTASDREENDYLGADISLYQDYILVGCPYKDNGGREVGQAYLYKRRENGAWEEIAILEASDKRDYERFGGSVALMGDYAYIGALQSDSPNTLKGKVYIFKNDGYDHWKEVEILIPGIDIEIGDSGYRFARCVSIGVYEEYIILGGRSYKKGAAIIYKKDTKKDLWQRLATIKPDEPIEGEMFASDVAITDELALIGSANYRTDTGGRVYVFKNDGDQWVEHKILRPDAKEIREYFGHSVAILNRTLIIGAWAIKLDTENKAGTVYFFD